MLSLFLLVSTFVSSFLMSCDACLIEQGADTPIYLAMDEQVPLTWKSGAFWGERQVISAGY